MSRPDEGLIHAWLDGELDAAEAARVEALVRDDPEWAAAAAEARGLIAASARIIGALDDVPAGVVPGMRAPLTAMPGAPMVSAPRSSRAIPWWRMRVAALLIVAVGTAVVLARSTPESDLALDKAAPAAAAAPAAGGELTQPAASARPAPQPRVSAPEQDRAVATPEPAQSRVPPATPAPQAMVQGAQRAVAQGAQQALTQRPQLADERESKDAPVRREASVAEKAGARTDSLKRLNLSQVVVTGAVSAPRSVQAAGAGAVAAAEAGKVAADIPVVPREECYRERADAAGTAFATYRVLRTSDSTATLAPADRARSADEFRRAVPTSAATFPVRGDTLFVRATGDAVRRALRVSCPPR